MQATRSIRELGVLVRSVGVQLGRLMELGREVEHLQSRVPVAASIEPDAKGVALSIGYTFFAARVKFVLHLLLTSLDPNEPLAWQVASQDVFPQSVPSADADSTALVRSQEEALRLKVGAVVEAHSRGFGRLHSIHTALMRAFCPS